MSIDLQNLFLDQGLTFRIVLRSSRDRPDDTIPECRLYYITSDANSHSVSQVHFYFCRMIDG